MKSDAGGGARTWRRLEMRVRRRAGRVDAVHGPGRRFGGDDCSFQDPFGDWVRLG